MSNPPPNLDAGWDSYVADVIPKGASLMQIQECRRAFYAGAKQVEYMLVQVGTQEHISEEKFEEILGEMYKQMIKFSEQVGTVHELARNVADLKVIESKYQQTEN